MTFAEALSFFGRYIWPVLLAWNVYLYRQIQATNRATYEYRLAMAKDYASKRDLEKMFDDFEKRLEKRLDQFVSLCNPK